MWVPVWVWVWGRGCGSEAVGRVYMQGDVSLTQRQNAKWLLNLDPNLLNGQQQEANDKGCWHHGPVTGLPQGEGHYGQPDDQKPGGVPAP